MGIRNIIGRIIQVTDRFIDWALFGKVTFKIIASNGIGGDPWEIEYRGRGDRIVGYWAYGYYDPAMPYPRNKDSK